MLPEGHRNSILSIKRTTPAECIVSDTCAEAGKASDCGEPKVCRIVDPARRMMALGMTSGEIKNLGLDENTLRTICEYARLDDAAGPASAAVAATLNTLTEEARKVDLEIEMLALRKRALHNRAKLLRRLAGMLELSDQDRS